MEAVKNVWKVRDLACIIDTLLFEKTGLSVNKHRFNQKPLTFHSTDSSGEIKEGNTTRHQHYLG